MSNALEYVGDVMRCKIFETILQETVQFLTHEGKDISDLEDIEYSEMKSVPLLDLKMYVVHRG